MKEELMQFILLPLMRSKESKHEVIRKSVELAKIVEDDYEQVSIIAGILTVTDKYIEEDYAQQVRSWLSMMKIERIIAREVEEAREQARAEEKLKVQAEIEKAEVKAKLATAKSFLDVLPPEIIAEKTGLSLEEVLSLKN